MTRKDEILAAAQRKHRWQDQIDLFVDGAEWSDENPKSQWISVNDAMPQKGELAVVIFRNDGNFNFLLLLYKGDGKWLEEINSGNTFARMFHQFEVKTSKDGSNGVVAWMSIPKPPKTLPIVFT